MELFRFACISGRQNQLMEENYLKIKLNLIALPIRHFRNRIMRINLQDDF